MGYKEEVVQLIDSLSSSRNDFQKQIAALTQDMSEAQTNHHREMLTLTQYNQTLTEALAEKTLLVEDLKKKQYENKTNQTKMQRTRTVLDIDDEEEFFYSQPSHSLHVDSKSPSIPSQSKKNRSFTPSQYTSSGNNKNGQYQPQTQRTNNIPNFSKSNGSSSTSSSSKSALQAKYAQYQKSGSKGYKSRNNKNRKMY